MNQNLHRARYAIALIATLLLGSSAALAVVPSARIGTASLLVPGTANGYYASWTAPGDLVRLTTTPNEIVELTRALDNNVDLIYELVRNNIATTWMYGLQKGALGTVIDRSGTPFDQAKLMVDLARQAGHTAGFRAGRSLSTRRSSWSGQESPVRRRRASFSPAVVFPEPSTVRHRPLATTVPQPFPRCSSATFG